MDLSEKLLEEFQKSFLDDDESNYKKGERLIGIYQTADEKSKEIIDDVFITLCGWSLQSLLEKAAE